MRYMMIMMPGGYSTAKPDARPTLEAIETMSAFNQELAKAGVLIDLNGLHPPAEGARVSYATGAPVVTDGPFAESKEVIGGYWIIDVSSREEAIEWAKRIPGSKDEMVEVRRVFAEEDFADVFPQSAG